MKRKDEDQDRRWIGDEEEDEDDTHWGCCCGGRCSGCAAGRGPECAGSRVDSAERVPSERLEQTEHTAKHHITVFISCLSYSHLANVRHHIKKRPVYTDCKIVNHGVFITLILFFFCLSVFCITQLQPTTSKARKTCCKTLLHKWYLSRHCGAQAGCKSSGGWAACGQSRSSPATGSEPASHLQDETKKHLFRANSNALLRNLCLISRCCNKEAVWPLRCRYGREALRTDRKMESSSTKSPVTWHAVASWYIMCRVLKDWRRQTDGQTASIYWQKSITTKFGFLSNSQEQWANYLLLHAFFKSLNLLFQNFLFWII